MKHLMTIAVIASTLIATPAFAGRDGVQIMQQERAVAERQARQPKGVSAAPPTSEARESPRERHLRLLKLFHPKHAY